MTVINDNNLNLDKILDFKINKAAIESMLGILLFPEIKEEKSETGITIKGIETIKSFWSSKKAVNGYIKLDYLKSIKDDLSNKIYHGYEEQGDQMPDNSNILLSFEFNSIYASYSSYEKHCIGGYELGKSRKEILSYGVLKSIIQLEYEVYHKLLSDFVKNIDGDSSLLFSSEYNIKSALQHSRKTILKQISFFDKYVK